MYSGVTLKKYAHELIGLPKKFRRQKNRDILMYKVSTREPVIVRYLTHEGSQGGFTALHWACLRNDRELALALIESGEDVYAKSYVSS